MTNVTTGTLTADQRLLAQRYAADMVDQAMHGEVDRAALVLAAGMLVTAEGRRVSIARQYQNSMSLTPPLGGNPRIYREATR